MQQLVRLLLSQRAKDGKPEIDFATDVSDFRLPEIQIEELRKGLRNSGALKSEQNIPDMHYSLRVSQEKHVITGPAEEPLLTEWHTEDVTVCICQPWGALNY